MSDFTTERQDSVSQSSMVFIVVVLATGPSMNEYTRNSTLFFVNKITQGLKQLICSAVHRHAKKKSAKYMINNKAVKQ